MSTFHIVLVFTILFFGCDSVLDQRDSAVTAGAAAVSSLNKQIEEFNTDRPPPMGITPISQRVSRVEHHGANDEILCFDQTGNVFLVMKREADGRFKGIVETPYHEAAFSGPGESHSWGYVLAEFYLEKELF